MHAETGHFLVDGSALHVGFRDDCVCFLEQDAGLAGDSRENPTACGAPSGREFRDAQSPARQLEVVTPHALPGFYSFIHQGVVLTTQL